MTRLPIAFAIAALAAALAAPPAVSAPPKPAAAETSQADKDWSTLRAYSVEKKKEAVAYGRDLMRDTDARIAELESKISEVSGQAKAKYIKELDELKAMRARTAARLDKMEQESGAAWNETKQGFADAYRDLQRAYHRTLRQLK